MCAVAAAATTATVSVGTSNLETPGTGVGSLFFNYRARHSGGVRSERGAHTTDTRMASHAPSTGPSPAHTGDTGDIGSISQVKN